MKYLLALITLVFSILSFSRTLIISDIDDTIKVSHILSLSGKITRASDVTTPFTGMAQLYQLILNQNIKDSRIVYLSNAPKDVAGIPALELSHKNFLSFNNFPTGDMELREDILDENHKINEIRRLVEQEKPDLMILIGDNGELDPEIYHQANVEFSKGIKIITFIHQMYSFKVPFYMPNILAEIGAKIYSEQVGFVTPMEIAVELRRQKLFDKNSYDWLIKNVSPYILNEGRFKWDGLKPITFPTFKNCQDFVWKWKLTQELIPIYKKIKNSCQ